MSTQPMAPNSSSEPACDARIRPFTNATELRCEATGDHSQHHGVLRDYAYPGSETTISWADTDRRNFRGEWIECPSRGCMLPAGHRGDHAP